MAKDHIKYRSGYKHQLAEDYTLQTPIKPKNSIETKFIAMDTSGVLTIREGYTWDGVSGPVVDTNNNLRASLVHDALYQLMRHAELSAEGNKNKADKLFHKLCKEDGVS
ncbi:MAG: DUF1353 domain-containing protein, partial [Pseudomonadota bacterium]